MIFGIVMAMPQISNKILNRYWLKCQIPRMLIPIYTIYICVYRYIYIHMLSTNPYVWTYSQEAIYACRINKSVANTKFARKNLCIFVAVNNHLAKCVSCGFFTFSEYCNFKWRNPFAYSHLNSDSHLNSNTDITVSHCVCSFNDLGPNFQTKIFMPKF